jgi:hypothetical protein
MNKVIKRFDHRRMAHPAERGRFYVQKKALRKFHKALANS